MNSTEDEARSVDTGWDAEEPSEDEVDQAWDSVPPPVSAALSSGAPSMAPATEEVDSGWDDVPEGAPLAAAGAGAGVDAGKRRPHRQRRAKSNAVVASANPVLLPRPAEPSKKHQREHARKQRAYEAQVKQQRKVERKAQRAAEMREEAATRLRQNEAEEQARQARREARARAEAERPAPAPRAPKAKRIDTSKPSTKKASAAVEVKQKETPAHSNLPKRGLRPGVLITLAVLAVVALLLVLRK